MSGTLRGGLGFVNICDVHDDRKCNRCRHCQRAKKKIRTRAPSGQSRGEPNCKYPRFVQFGQKTVEVLYGQVMLLRNDFAIIGFGPKRNRRVRVPVSSFRRVVNSENQPTISDPSPRIPREREIVGCVLAHSACPWFSHQDLLMAMG